MKIYILPIDKKFQPDAQAYKYPQHNDDFGVEQDFLEYLLENKYLLTNDYKEADWHYLPVFWTRWHVNHNYAKNGVNELQNAVNEVMLDDQKTFTICQYDDGPMVNLNGAKIFLSSRMTGSGLDIPLLSSLHKKNFSEIKKKYLASFIGNLESHIIRGKMAKALKNRKDIFVFDSHKKRNFLWQKLLQAYILLFFGDRSKFFVKKTLQSYVSLCPRGYGGSSFRFFEAMQLGIVPFLIGDIDTRPFKDLINWDEISFYTNNTDKIIDIITSAKNDNLVQMGKKAQKIYQKKLNYKKWCSFVIKELENYAGNNK